MSCPKVKNFWRELREWLNTNVNIELSLEDREILFSYTGNNELVNYIYALAKRFIYQNKFISRNINIQGFICLLKKKMLREKYISFLNSKINKFFKKWSPVYNYFFPTVTEEWDSRYPCWFLMLAFCYWSLCLSILYFFTFFQPFIMSGKLVLE